MATRLPDSALTDNHGQGVHKLAYFDAPDGFSCLRLDGRPPETEKPYVARPGDCPGCGKKNSRETGTLCLMCSRGMVELLAMAENEEELVTIKEKRDAN